MSLPPRTDRAELLGDMLADLEELVTCESPSADLAAVARSAQVVARVGERRLGVAPEIIEIDGRTHLRWRFGAATGEQSRALLLGHHDTVWPIGSLAEHPWRVEQGRVSGPGCFDMKAGLVQLFHAVAALPDPTGITVLITGDEEIGAPSSRTLIEEEARRAGHALVLEASADGGHLKIARKGISLYDVQVTGRAAHAGLEPQLGANTTVAAAELVLALTALDEGPEATTVTPTLLTSGVAANTVPARASLRVDVRVPTLAAQQRVHDEITRLTTAGSHRVPDATFTLTRLAGHPPLERSSSAALFDLARRVGEDLGLGTLHGVGVGGASDGNLAAGAGAATLDGLGAVGGGAHAPGEHVIAEEMPGRTALLTGVLTELLDGWSAGTTGVAQHGAAAR